METPPFDKPRQLNRSSQINELYTFLINSFIDRLMQFHYGGRKIYKVIYFPWKVVQTERNYL